MYLVWKFQEQSITVWEADLVGAMFTTTVYYICNHFTNIIIFFFLNFHDFIMPFLSNTVKPVMRGHLGKCSIIIIIIILPYILYKSNIKHRYTWPE